MLKGLPASGKTTWAKKKVRENPGLYKRINKDDLRAMLDDSKWSKDNEKFVLKIRDLTICQALADGKHVIVDDTNFAPKHLERMKEIAKEYNAVVKEKFFLVSVEECIKRDASRENSVGEEVIRKMYNQFLKPEVEQYVPPMDKPPAYIFDIDGTLAHMTTRNPFDWDRVCEDDENYNVSNVLKELRRCGYKIIIFTGRDGCCEDKTKEWLKDNYIKYDHFDIRPTGNTEKDAIIKKRMFDKIKDDYAIIGVFDDRDQVVKMWRSLGLTCFQVGEGDF